jgi:hypothetical protein
MMRLHGEGTGEPSGYVEKHGSSQAATLAISKRRIVEQKSRGFQ